MSLKEKIKDMQRRNYELSIEELERKGKRKKYMGIIYAILSIVFFIFAVIILMQITVLLTLDKITNYIIILAVIAGTVINILMILEFKYSMYCLDFSRDRDFIDIMIYLKKQNGE